MTKIVLLDEEEHTVASVVKHTGAEHRRQANRGRRAVLGQLLAQHVQLARWSGDDRLAVEVAADVVGELGRGLIAAGALLFEGLEDDRLDVAPQPAVDYDSP